MKTTEEPRWTVFESGGQWHVRYLDPTDHKFRQHRIARATAQTKSQARAYAARWYPAFCGETKNPAPSAPKPSAVTIKSLAPAWFVYVDANPKLQQSTRKQLQLAMQNHVLPHPISNTPITELTTGALRAWVRDQRDTPSDRTGKPLASSTVRNTVNSISSFFNWAMCEDLVSLPSNPLKHPGIALELPEGGTQWANEIPMLSKEHVETLCTCQEVPEWRRVHHLLAATSGLAQGEIFGLLWADLDLTENTLRVGKAYALLSTDNKPGFQGPKTKNRLRVLPIHTLAARSLRAWKDDGWRQFVGRAPNASDPVFPTSDGHAWRPPMAGMLRDDLQAAGLPTTTPAGHNITAHALRRTFATFLEIAEVSEPVRRRLLGHAGRGVTDSSYTAKTLEMMRKAVESIRLDLSVGEVLQLRLRAVGDSDENHVLSTPQAISYCGSQSQPAPGIHETPCFEVPPAGIGPATFGLGRAATECAETREDAIRFDSSPIEVETSGLKLAATTKNDAQTATAAPPAVAVPEHTKAESAVALNESHLHVALVEAIKRGEREIALQILDLLKGSSR